MLQLMAALLVLLLLLAVPPTAFTANVYYVTADDAGHQLSCPPHQICHNLSYYISQPDYYFTSDTTIIFLEGQHNFNITDLVQVNNVHNLTLKGQGQWPVAGAEETVMQSTVIINCTRGRGGFIFDTGYYITIAGLTITNCGYPRDGVFLFTSVGKLFFHKNSIQFMSGYGLKASNCESVKVTNCSYYHSVKSGSGVVIFYGQSFHNSIANYTLELTYSNFTKCYNSQSGGGIQLHTGMRTNVPVKVVFSHLIVSHNSASLGGGLSASLGGTRKSSLEILNSYFFNCSAVRNGGGVLLQSSTKATITIKNTDFVENTAYDGLVDFFMSELVLVCRADNEVNFSLLDSTIVHTKASKQVVYIINCRQVTVSNTLLRMANQKFAGFESDNIAFFSVRNSRFEGCHNLPSVLLIMSHQFNDVTIHNSTFFNNTGGRSVITLYRANTLIVNSSISDNSMTGITAIKCHVQFYGRNVIQNNRYTEGAGIILSLPGIIAVQGELYLLNNTAEYRGGAILVIPLPKFSTLHTKHTIVSCSLTFHGYDSIYFSGNKAGKGGDDVYGATLIGCEAIIDNSAIFASHVGQRNETSWYFESPLIKYLHISSTNRLSSISSDPIMVCFCNISNLPDCSDRTHHIQTYPGLEINTTIATVGYYGGTSPGVVHVSAQHAKLLHFYGQNGTIECFQLHILLQNTSSTTALVDIKVEGGLQDWGLSLTVDILECPIGFVAVDQTSGQQQCRCVLILTDNNVQCNVSLQPYKFLRSGNSWFVYINNTQCVTGTSNCPFGYCNRSNVSFDIMAPDRQCLGNRAGILCGQCQSHLSIVLGSNRCDTCSNWYLFLLPVFALAGIVLVAVLMFFNLSVSVGTINGLLFYANIVKFNEAFFFPNGSIPVVSQFISWLNLDLGIEVCFFNGLDGYWNTWLQFVFPAYLFLLMGGIIVSFHYSARLCRLCGSRAVPTIATLFLMSYTKILLTVKNALSMSQLPCNDSILTVWSVDGNIEYGSVKHLILVIFSCGVLVVGLAYPVLVLCAPLLERYSDKCIPQHKWNPVAKFKPLLDAYGGPYRDKYRFWTGVTLMVRPILTVIFSFTSGGLAVVNTAIIISVIVGILTVWFFTNGVYKSVYHSGLEVFYLLNLFFLCTVSLTTTSLHSTSYQVATIVSICLSFAVFLVTVAVHFKQNVNLKKIKRKLGFNDGPAQCTSSQVAADVVDDDKEDKLPPGSPPSIVYSSRRGDNQFFLEFPSYPRNDEEQESSSPMLLEREPLLLDTNTSSQF